MTVDKLRIVSLDALKRQMKIDFEEDDDLIVMYGVASEDAIINTTRRSYEELGRLTQPQNWMKNLSFARHPKPSFGTPIKTGYIHGVTCHYYATSGVM